MSRLHSGLLLGAIGFGGAAFLGAGAAAAQERIPIGDWRQESRPKKTDRSKQRFAIEIRLGTYYPQVDSEFAGTGRAPYAQAYGHKAQFYFGLEFDWQALRIPFVGALGPGFGWGFTQRSQVANITGTNQASAETTTFTIMPWTLSAVLRADELMRRTGIPLVPYAKLGLAFGMWSASNNQGVDYWPRPTDPNTVRGRGTTWGEHFALGGMLCLNYFDPKAASTLDTDAGINHAYVFGEWMNTKLDGIGSRPQMHIGTSSWVVGIALDM